MDLVAIYAIAAGGIFLTLTLIHLFYLTADSISLKILKYLTYPYLLKRHSLAGPWTPANVLLCVIYGAINIFFVSFQASSADAGRRAGTLSLVNMAFVFAATHLSILADILGISLQNCRRIHRTAGWAAGALLAFHIVGALVVRQENFPLHQDNLFALIGAGCLAAILLLSLPFVRRFSYEIFLRTHQAIAAVCVYSTWRHLPSDSYFPRMYIYIPLTIMLLISLAQLSKFLYCNGILPSRAYPFATVTCKKRNPSEKKEQTIGNPIKIRVALPRPLKVKAGQYVNLWMPSICLGSWMQSHPFMVTSWSPGKQDVLEIFVQTRRGLTAKLEARTALEGSASFSAFVSGPHGLSEPVGQYESVLAVASDFGIAGVIPYLKQVLHGYNTSTSQTRRVHFVWQVQSREIAVAAQPLLNSLLTDDVLDDGYILEMSFYVGWNMKAENEKLLGSHNRAIIYTNVPNYEDIISAEASGDLVERLPNTQEKKGKLLVIGKDREIPTVYVILSVPASTSDQLRDDLRNTVRSYLGQKVRMYEPEFQPV